MHIYILMRLNIPALTTPLHLPSFTSSTTQNAGVEGKVPAGILLDKVTEKSPTKARQPRKVDLRARYWAFLFDNLRRAVDEIYVTCESDQSVVECKVGLFVCVNACVHVWVCAGLVYKTK